jgi:hypothetical protein
MGPDILHGEGETADPRQDDSFEGLSPETRAALSAQQRGLHANAATSAEASARPLPGPLAQAFAPRIEEVAGFKVRAPKHYDFVALQVLESPLLEEFKAASRAARLRALGKKVKRRPPTPWTDEQGYEIIYQFTRPAEELIGLVQAADRKAAVLAYRQKALREVGLQLGPVEVALLVAAVSREFESYFATWLRYENKAAASGNGETVFTMPPPVTAPVGGSTIIAG